MTTLRTLVDWRRAADGGADLRALLRDRLAAIRAALTPGVWIYLASDHELEAQLAVLDPAAPLFGTPFAVKDNIDIAGVPTTAACPAFARTPTRHAAVVRKLIDAGAVWLGKTNLDQFATGLVGTRSPYGRPACVDDPIRISGGSSSGSAVAVARGDVAFALGTDTAGSGRVPAGFNGVVGMKPTFGRVGKSGVLPACRTLDCVSLFAHDVAGAAQLLSIVEGDDPLDAYSRFVAGPGTAPLKLRVGVPVAPEFFGDAGYESMWLQATERLHAIGAELVPVDFGPLHETAALLYSGPWVAERHAVVQDLLASNPAALDPTVRQVIQGAHDFSATDTFRAQYRLREAQVRHAALWHTVDALMVPTAPGHPRFDEIDADPIGVNARLGCYTNFVNLLGWCALALPAGRTPGGLPFGVTFIQPGAHDAALAGIGLRWEQGRADPDRPVSAWPASARTLPLAVVGAHLCGLPLNHQLVERGARLREEATTAPLYRLHALPGTNPPKPGLVRVAANGAAIAVEVWEMPVAEVGSFLAGVAAPLGLGSLELANGECVHGFLCEAHAVVGAVDITALGGWRAYLAASAAHP